MHQHAFKLGPDTHFSRPGPTVPVRHRFTRQQCGCQWEKRTSSANQCRHAGTDSVKINFRFIIHLRLPKNCYYPDPTVLENKSSNIPSTLRANDPSYIRYHDFYRDKQGLLRFLDFIAINRFLSELFNLVGYFWRIFFLYNKNRISLKKSLTC